MGQGRLQIEILQVAVPHLTELAVEEIGGQRREDHQDAHGEQPDDERGADVWPAGQGQGQERDECHPCHSVGFKAVGGRADTVAGVVARAVGDHAGVLGVVFRQFEHDFHQVGADVGNLREDATADAQGAGSEGFANGKSDETGPDEIPWQEGQDADHEEQLHAHQQEAHAHARL